MKDSTRLGMLLSIVAEVLGLSKDRCSNSYIDYIAYRFALCRERGRGVGDYMYQLRSTLFTQRFRS